MPLDQSSRFVVTLYLLGASAASSCTMSHQLELEEHERVKRNREVPILPPSIEELGLSLGEHVELVYRETPVEGKVVEGGVVVWDDVLVTTQELARDTDTYLGPRRRRVDKGAQRTGALDFANYRWPDGVVLFTWGDFTGAANAANRAIFQTAMNNWENAVPGLDFQERTGTQPHYIVFKNPNDSVTCRSATGRVGSAQDLLIDANAASGCMTVSVVMHELGHAIGLWHEQQRSDLASNATITWGNLAGCPNSATGPGNCGAAACMGIELQCGCAAGDATCLGAFGNYMAAADSRRLEQYDLGSLMHYRQGQWAKCANPAFTIATCPAGTGQLNSITPVPNNAANQALLAGAGTAISPRDAVAAGLMYPKLRAATVAFAPASAQQICTLWPRTDDANTYMTMTATPSFSINNRGQANLTTPGTYSISCNARSIFWFFNYDYPNAVDLDATDDPFFDGSRESWTTAGTLRVLSAGLMPLLF